MINTKLLVLASFVAAGLFFIYWETKKNNSLLNSLLIQLRELRASSYPKNVIKYQSQYENTPSLHHNSTTNSSINSSKSSINVSKSVINPNLPISSKSLILSLIHI